jgi:hypothetical protein
VPFQKEAPPDSIHPLDDPFLGGKGREEVNWHSGKDGVKQLETGSLAEKTPLPCRKSIGHLVDQWLIINTSQLSKMQW